MATVRARPVIAVAMALIGSVAGGSLTQVAAQSPTPTRTSSPHRASCVGDCDDDGVVIVSEIVTGVNIALDRAEISDCPAFACNGPDAKVFVNCGVGAVHNALGGCPNRTPTPTPVGFIRYRLVQAESQLTKMDAYPGPIIQTMSWPMSGTLDVIATEPSEGQNVFQFTITRIEFEAADHTVSGHSGEIVVREGTGRVAMAATVAIDGEAVELSGDAPVSVLPDSYPPDLTLRVCGASGQSASCATLNSGAASGYSLSIRAVPDAVQTPLPTRTPIPTVSVIYDLVEGSTIFMALPTPGASPIVEPLSGMFVARVDCRDPVDCLRLAPNTLFAMTITSISFQSEHFTVTGTGGIVALTFDLLNAVVGGDLLIGGQSIHVSGQGPFDTFDPSRFPPSFTGIELCGGGTNHASCDAIRAGVEGGYVLTLFAVPQPALRHSRVGGNPSD